VNNTTDEKKNAKTCDRQLLRNIEALAARVVKEKPSFLSIFLMAELWVFNQLRSFFSYTDGKENVESNCWEFSGKLFAFLITIPITIMLWFFVRPVICLVSLFIITAILTNKIWFN